MIQLKEITKDNFQECIELDLYEDQWNYVAPNIYSIAGAYVALTNKDFVPILYSIYHNDIMVGFIAMSYEREENSEDYFYDIYRFMIDKRFQAKGYGKDTLRKAIETLKTFPCGKATSIRIIYTKDNTKSKKLYESVGFIDTGAVNDDGEIIAQIEL